jgi:two-component system CheB/CheR fusion protein
VAPDPADPDLRALLQRLQSTVEELETINEELQSSNEELETMNEELQTSYSEIETTSGDLRQRAQEAEQASAVMGSLLRGLKLSLIVVDAQLRVRTWQGRSEDLWGPRASEVEERLLTTLDIGLPLDRASRLVRACLASPDRSHQAEVAAVNRRGRRIRCRIVASALQLSGGAPGVALLVDELPHRP